jgi:hypothetical protein
VLLLIALGCQNGLLIDLQGPPLLDWSETDGKTTLALRYAVRNARTRVPLAPGEFEQRLLLDGEPIDPESILDEGQVELQSTLYLHLILDSSYSMLEHEPPAFDPMLQAVEEVLDQAEERWSGDAKEFRWQACWFSELIYCPMEPSQDLIGLIPEPEPGDSTKLYSAVAYSVDQMRAAYESGVAAGERDQHILVVFSDGADNYSWFDNSEQSETGDGFVGRGHPATELSDVKEAIEAHPALTVHVIGLGSDIDDDALQTIATTGGGIYEPDTDPEKIGALFERVALELVSQTEVGVTIPLQPGDYTFELQATNGLLRGSETFDFRAGDADARILDARFSSTTSDPDDTGDTGDSGDQGDDTADQDRSGG